MIVKHLYSVREIVKTVIDLLDAKIEVKFSGEKRKNEVPNTVANISKAKTLLNWRPKIGLREGLRTLIPGLLEKNR